MKIEKSGFVKQRERGKEFTQVYRVFSFIVIRVSDVVTVVCSKLSCDLQRII